MATFANDDNQDYIIALLKDYKASLIKELQFLPIDYDHPLRAARALAKLNDQKESNLFAQNLDQFNQEAQNSKYYPNTRRLGSIVGDLLFLGSILAIIILLPINLFTALAVTLLTWAYITNSGRWEPRKPVIDACDDGKNVGRFFSLAPKKKTDEPSVEIPDSLTLGSVDN